MCVFPTLPRIPTLWGDQFTTFPLNSVHRGVDGIRAKPRHCMGIRLGGTFPRLPQWVFASCASNYLWTHSASGFHPPRCTFASSTSTSAAPSLSSTQNVTISSAGRWRVERQTLRPCPRRVILWAYFHPMTKLMYGLPSRLTAATRVSSIFFICECSHSCGAGRRKMTLCMQFTWLLVERPALEQVKTDVIDAKDTSTRYSFRQLTVIYQSLDCPSPQGLYGGMILPWLDDLHQKYFKAGVIDAEDKSSR